MCVCVCVCVCMSCMHVSITFIYLFIYSIEEFLWEHSPPTALTLFSQNPTSV